MASSRREINHRSRAAWACIRRISQELFDRARAPWRLKVRLLRAEAIEALLYGCMTWAPRRGHYRLLSEEDTPSATPASYRVPPRARHLPIAFVRSGPQKDWMPKRGSYHPTTVTCVRGSHGQTTRRAPPDVSREDLGKGRPEQNWLDCLNDDFQAFGSTDDSTVDNRLTVGVDRVVWTLGAKMDDGAP